MPFEVKPIPGPSAKAGHTSETRSRTHEDVAKDIGSFYDHAAEQGGRVVAGHTVVNPMTSQLIQRGGFIYEGTETLYLVAEMPETPETP